MNARIGIDPGLSGALAKLDPATGDLTVLDMPVHEVRGKSQPDLYAVGRWLDFVNRDVAEVVIEDVGAMPGQGVSSMFRFGFVTGALHGLVCANFLPLRLVRPAVWKKAMGLTQDKDSSRQMATRLWPRHAHLFARKKDADRAEAALLALYGERTKG